MLIKKWAMIGMTAALIFCVCACGNKTGLEGRLVDGKGQGLAGVKVIAKQVQPVPGYEQFETITGRDGTFKFGKMSPSSRYVLEPWSEKWTTTASVTAESGPEGKVAALPAPLSVRYTVSKEGVIADSATGLEWVVGPNRDISYNDALTWVKGCRTAGGGWRMPTRAELRTLYARGAGAMNIAPLFKLKSCCVWAQPRDAALAWGFDFNAGKDNWNVLGHSISLRVFGVRPFAHQ